ncbi:hypothetical protein IIC65_00880 [Candidatus Sumerlaeota bacterium]|nr:hypothetical protein [Candidatus Sumerlaeota bacterium]
MREETKEQETNPTPAQSAPAPDEEGGGWDSEAPPEEMSLPAEFVLFLRENKKWWLVPIIVMVMLLGALLFFGSSPAAPFIYTLF